MVLVCFVVNNHTDPIRNLCRVVWDGGVATNTNAVLHWACFPDGRPEHTTLGRTGTGGIQPFPWK